MQKEILSRIQQSALSYSDRLCDFTCIQTTARSIGPQLDGAKWKPLETRESELSYFDHREHYKLLKVDGETTDLQQRIKKGYFRGSGQFGSALRRIFDPKVNATYELDHVEAGATCVVRYTVPQETSALTINADKDHVKLGYHGTVWADCATGAVTRFRTETDIGHVRRMGLSVSLAYRLEVRYALAKIGSQEFLLPQSAIDDALFYKTWTKTEIHFQGYRKYAADSTVKFDEVETPSQQP